MAATILGPDGVPLPPSKPRGVVGSGMGRAGALNTGGYGTAYDAADISSSHMEGWLPYLGSADADLNPHRDRIAARARDMERNDGWAKSGVMRTVDNVVGASFKPIFKPDYRALAFYSGNKKYDAVWASEYAEALAACWRTWADDINHYNDAMQCLSISQLLWVAFRHKLIDGDSLAVLLYRPETVGPGRARYATSVQLIDPDRLSNPQMTFDSLTRRGGVEIDQYGAPIGYHIRRAHLGDWFTAAQSMQWDYLPKQTAWGRPVVVHDYDHERASQHRGGAGMLTPVMQRLKMLIKYDGTELDAAIINAIFAAYVKSPYDPQMVEEALTEGPDKNSLGAYQDFRNEFWEGKRNPIGDAKMVHLAPGEELGTVTAARPSGNFEPFEASILRHVAAGQGITYEQLTGDYSRTNYSSFKGASNEVKKTFDRRAKNFEDGTANPIVNAFVEEIHDIESLPMPTGSVMPFEQMRSAYSRCKWIGPARGYVDEVAEKQGAILGMEAGLSTLELEAASQGMDYKELIHQRGIELKEMEAQGIKQVPAWLMTQQPAPGKEAGDKPAVPGDGK